MAHTLHVRELERFKKQFVTGCLGLMEARMIEDGHIDHEQLLRLGKVLLLLVEREDLLVRLPVVYQLTQKSLPIEELNRAS